MQVITGIDNAPLGGLGGDLVMGAHGYGCVRMPALNQTFI